MSLGTIRAFFAMDRLSYLPIELGDTAKRSFAAFNLWPLKTVPKVLEQGDEDPGSGTGRNVSSFWAHLAAFPPMFIRPFCGVFCRVFSLCSRGVGRGSLRA